MAGMNIGKTSRFSAAVLCFLIVAWCEPAQAQQEAGRRVYDEQLRVRLDQQLPQAREIGLDGGGWFNFALFKYDDPPARRFRTLRQYQLRLWGSANIRGVHKFYVRGLVGWDDWNSGDNPGDVTGDETTNPQVERAWYQFDLGQMLRNQTGTAPPASLRVKVGRQFAAIGTSFVLSMPLDMVQFNATVGNWEFMAFLGMTIRNTRNIDDSDAVSRDQQRCIWGVEVAYNGLDHHRPFAYFMENNDHTNADPADPLQAYDYSSRYIGIGSEGTIILPNLRYQTELVGELGRTYGEGVTGGTQDEICAVAYNLLLEYLFQTKTHPKVTAEYIFASGDSDRRSSSTSTIGGNRAGTKDNAFNAFGFRDTGIAFSPRVSNLNMYMLGASFFPLEDIELFKQLEVGTKLFFYHKSADGPISDVDASVNNSRWLGWEWDIYANWRITSDLTWTIRYGAFQPGSAFGNDDRRQFLYTAVTFSF